MESDPGIKLNPEVDLEVDVSNLSSEFRKLSILMYRYCKYNASVKSKRDMAKANLKETRAIAYKKVRSDISAKHTQTSIEAEVDTDPTVLDAQKKLIRAEHDLTTWEGAVEGMRFKKDCLIQLGADARKERQ